MGFALALAGCGQTLGTSSSTGGDRQGAALANACYFGILGAQVKSGPDQGVMVAGSADLGVMPDGKTMYGFVYLTPDKGDAVTGTLEGTKLDLQIYDDQGTFDAQATLAMDSVYCLEGTGGSMTGPIPMDHGVWTAQKPLMFQDSPHCVHVDHADGSVLVTCSVALVTCQTTFGASGGMRPVTGCTSM